MRNIAAYLLAVLGGNSAPDAAAINKILGAAGVEGDNERIDKLIAELKDKDIWELINEGSKKLASMPTGGAAPAAAAAAAPGGAAPAAKAEAPKAEEKEESDEEMGFGLFD